MSKDFYVSKKFWTAIITCTVAIVIYFTGNHQLAELIAMVGATLIAGFGLADLGKEKR